MFLADFDYDILYIWREDNSVADALSQMPDAPPSPALAACALAYTHSPPCQHAAGILHISADESFLAQIKKGYKNDTFCKQLISNITDGSIKGAREENQLLYVGCCLVIPQDIKV